MPQSQVILSEMGGENIRAEDIETLRPGCWLNSTVVNAFVSLLYKESVSILNSWFFAILEKEDENGFARLAGWVKGKDLEKIRLILIPIHSEKCKHWVLLAIDKRHASIQLYDSMPSLHAFDHATKLVGNWCTFLKEFLHLENWPMKWDASPHPCLSHHQQNSIDCGVFACINAFLLSEGSTTISLPSRNTSILRKSIERSILEKRLQVNSAEDFECAN